MSSKHASSRRRLSPAAAAAAACLAGETVSLHLTDQHGNRVGRDVLTSWAAIAPELSVAPLTELPEGAGAMRWLHGDQELLRLPASAWQLHQDKSALVLPATSVLGPVPPAGRKGVGRCARRARPAAALRLCRAASVPCRRCLARPSPQQPTPPCLPASLADPSQPQPAGPPAQRQRRPPACLCSGQDIIIRVASFEEDVKRGKESKDSKDSKDLAQLFSHGRLYHGEYASLAWINMPGAGETRRCRGALRHTAMARLPPHPPMALRPAVHRRIAHAEG